jgi:hypothetical protein
MGMQELYDAVVNLQEMLRNELHNGTDLVARPADDYRHIKALAATYELQEYLANRIATTGENETEEPFALDSFDREVL